VRRLLRREPQRLDHDRFDLSWVIVAGRPGLGSSLNPSSRRSANRERQFVTVDAKPRAARRSPRLLRPSAAAITSAPATRGPAHSSVAASSSPGNLCSSARDSIATAVGIGMRTTNPSCQRINPGH
jgi:hypothetical protein